MRRVSTHIREGFLRHGATFRSTSQRWKVSYHDDRAISAAGCCIRSNSPTGGMVSRKVLSATRPLLSATTADRLQLHVGDEMRDPSGDVDGDEEEELLRSLVQDAFHPAAATSPKACSPAVKDAAKQEVVRGGPSGPPQSLNGKKASAEAFTANTALAGDGHDAIGSTVLAARAGNAQFGPFSRLRRKCYTFNVNNHNGIVSREESIEWMCTHCQTFNFMNRATCRHCGSPATDSHRDKHPPVRHVVLFPSVWLCTGCGARNDSTPPAAEPTTASGSTAADSQSPSIAPRKKFMCNACGSFFAGAADWCCTECHTMNSKAAVQCASCFLDRPVSWTCKGCNAEDNSIFSLVCRTCQQQRAPIRESDAVVRCGCCNSRNDVRWELCGSCMAPLPAMGDTVTQAQCIPDHTDAARLQARPVLPPPVVDMQLTSFGVDQANFPGLQEPLGKGTSLAAAQSRHHHVGSRETMGGGSISSGGEVAGAWWCVHCNVIQRRNAPFCDICLRPRLLAQQHDNPSAVGGVSDDAKTTAQPSSTPSSTIPTAVPPGSWQCPYCRQYQVATERSCCGHNREVPNAYWMCDTCASINRNARKVCIGCDEARRQQPWVCPTCQSKNAADDFDCTICGIAHPSLWRCASCRNVAHTSDTACGRCGAERPPTTPHVVCPVCAAPNTSTRKSCFRCRARLGDDTWKCVNCKTAVADRTLARCPACHTARDYDLTEETWVCDVCETAIASGGSLPVREECPRCGGARDNKARRSLSFPSRWRCRRCRLQNFSRSPTCVECGEKRFVPTLNATVSCPHCFRRTVLDSQEVCQHCAGSLSAVLTDAGTAISVGGRGLFTALEDTDVFAETPPPHSRTIGTADGEAGAHSSFTTARPSDAPSDATALATPTERTAAPPVTASHIQDDSLLDDDSVELEPFDGDEEWVSMMECSDECQYSPSLQGELEAFPPLATWICVRCESSNTEEYLACVGCGAPHP